MKHINIYLTTSTQSIQHMKHTFRFMLKILQKNTCRNLNDFIQEAVSSNSFQYHTITKQNNQLYTKSLKLINKANFLIADTTYASITVGRQIEYALQKGIPVLCLINTDHATYISPSMFETEIGLQTFRSYKDKTLATVLSEYIRNYKDKKLRFNLFISRENENFLNWLSHKLRLSKSEIIRKFIEDKMSKNKEYLKLIR